MKLLAPLRTACLLATTLVLTGALASTKDLEALMSKDGLQKISVKGVDLAYARPGATLAAYKRVKLDPVEVEFSKSWNPTRTGSSLKLSTDEREKIRSGVAKLVEEEFARELQANNKYPVVAEAAPDVLRVKARIVNLYVNAPDTGTGRSRTFVSSAGEMTLVAELSDSTSGQVLARVADRREAKTSRMQMTNSIVNESEARIIAAAWAKTLHKALDKAQGIGSR
ncbi:MAG: DUF3313 domain-containing protein [Burkholderiales bacterium]|nr:DUF3313 domain-containing protein [Burkholderiales bacterium]